MNLYKANLKFGYILYLEILWTGASLLVHVDLIVVNFHFKKKELLCI